MAKKLVIVESPTKAKTIDRFLGKDFIVIASYGHIRDLPNNAAEIPKALKKDAWTRLGINVEQDFEPLYVIPDQKKGRVKDLKDAMKDADELYLATDEDREGESISWHLVEVLKPKIPTKRLVFHEITKEAIAHALANTREINENLVKAQETRRLVDRLFGYTLSPLLWKKVGPRLSAGRVQSVAMRLLVQRERERIKFVNASYWDLKGNFQKQSASSKEGIFEAELTHLGEKRIASGKDFDADTGKLKSETAVVLLGKDQADKLFERLKNKPVKVLEIESKPFTQKPSPPFTTSTLQQDASRKLSFSARRTMSVAQTLYENGFITYMRTDSTILSAEALKGSRDLIGRDFGKEFLPPEPRIYKTKVKNAQEAHEAIRPAGVAFATFDDVRKRLGIEAFKLYELIWKRTIASQMKDAHGTRVGVRLECEEAIFRASGKTIEFAGFLRAYVEGSDDPEADLADQEKILPALTKGEELKTVSLEKLEHITQPPARYTEGSLIKELERLGIGRPSTWATIVDVVLRRDYAFKKNTALVPTFLATALTGLMERYFSNLVDYQFTAELEDDLDRIALGEADGGKYLKKFFFGNGHPGVQGLVKSGEEKIDPRDVCGIPLGTTEDSRAIEVRIGRYGPFISDGENRASVPDLLPPDELTLERAIGILEEAARGPVPLGADPATQKPIYLKSGRFGPYIQLGDHVEGEEEKPKMASLLPGMTPDSVTLETAIQILSLPRSLGTHPEIGEEVIATSGRYGPYVKSGTETRSINMDEYSPITITFEQALEVLKQPKRRGRGATSTKPLRELGKHPITELELVIKSGRFGPYVTDGTLNASLPRGREINDVTVEEAVGLLEARALKIAEQGDMPQKKGKRGSTKKAKTPAKSKSKKAAKEKTPKTKTTKAKATKTKAKKSPPKATEAE